MLREEVLFIVLSNCTKEGKPIWVSGIMGLKEIIFTIRVVTKQYFVEVTNIILWSIMAIVQVELLYATSIESMIMANIASYSHFPKQIQSCPFQRSLSADI